jgi:hypothetical protein
LRAVFTGVFSFRHLFRYRCIHSSARGFALIISTATSVSPSMIVQI